MMKNQQQPLRKILLSAPGVLLLGILLVLVNAVFSNANFRWDTTEDSLYTLSGGTANILANLSHPVTIQFYFSRSNPEVPVDFKLYAKRVWEFLQEYKQASGGKVIIQRHDPRPDSDDEIWARKLGLKSMLTESGQPVFCGLVFSQADLEERIAWLDPAQERTLEYDISRIVHQLQSPEKKVLGIVSYLPIFGQGNSAGRDAIESGTGVGTGARTATGRPWSFVNELKEVYRVRPVSASADKIDPEVDLLLVIQPKDMHLDLRFAIDQYVLAGGNAIFLVDPYCVADTGTKSQKYIAGPQRSTRDLFAAWGISVDFGKVLKDLDLASRDNLPGNDTQQPFHISARGESLNQTSLLTSNLEALLLPLPGAIRIENESATVQPLIQSGTNAALVAASQVGAGPAIDRATFEPTGQRYNLAVHIRGRFQTAFPEGPPPAGLGRVPAHKTPLKSAIKPATIVVVADVDFIADRAFIQYAGPWGQQRPQVVNDNMNFLVNVCEILTGSDNLIELRTRGTFERPFTRVIELERNAREKWRAKEKELTEGFEAVTRKLRFLESQKSPSQQLLGLSPQQAAAIEKMKYNQQQIQLELKAVRKSFRADVETLGTILKAVNIFLLPLLVTLVGIGYGVYRHGKINKR